MLSILRHVFYCAGDEGGGSPVFLEGLESHTGDIIATYCNSYIYLQYETIDMLAAIAHQIFDVLIASKSNGHVRHSLSVHVAYPP